MGVELCHLLLGEVDREGEDGGDGEATVRSVRVLFWILDERGLMEKEGGLNEVGEEKF